MSEEQTRQVMDRYLATNHSDVSMMADDVTFTVLANGDSYRGREGVKQLLDYFYRGAFDAHAKARNLIVSDEHAVWEGHFIGKHVGEFAGIPATGKDVCVPLAVIYDLKDGEIHRGRVYFEMPVLLQQLGVDSTGV